MTERLNFLPFSKLTPDAAYYRPSERPGMFDCHICEHRRGSQCQVMAGSVARGYVCDHFLHLPERPR